MILQRNDLKAVETRQARGDGAGEIAEPAICNTSAIPNCLGCLEGVHAARIKAGSTLIFDDVIIGYWLATDGTPR
jgi:glutamate-1-semialdehyde aminotransferase